jgi:predicted PurR-regulated permease PerM
MRVDRPGWGKHWRNPDLVRFLIRVLIVAAIFALVFLAWWIRGALLLAFVSVVIAALLLAIASPIKKYTPLTHMWALALVAALLAAFAVVLVWSMGAQLQAQVASLAQSLPEALKVLEQDTGIQFLPDGDSGLVQGADSIPSLQSLLARIASFGTSLASMFSSLVLVIVAGFFLAAEPETYQRGFVKLFPMSQQPRIDETLTDCGHALRLWLIATFIGMSIVGALVALGTWLIGLPAPLALGLFAFLAEFVPVIGPIIGAVPALLLALTQDTSTFLWTAMLYLAIQQLESNMITPLVQRRMVTIPPALLLFSVTTFGILFGFLGILVAAPLTVVVYVAVKKLYVRETLGQATTVPGEDAKKNG